MADVFFSLHVEGIGGLWVSQGVRRKVRMANGVAEPIYVSETVDRTMNPTFRQIDNSACGPAITRLNHLILKVWIKSAKMEQWRQHLEMSLSMRNLQYLGKSLDRFHHVLPPNAVILHLTDGVYTHFTSLSDYIPPPISPSARTTSARTLPTSSFDALLRLSKLDDSIQDAIATRDKIAADLEALLEANKDALAERDQVAEADDRLKTIDFAKRTVEKQLDKARKQQVEKRDSISKRREFMSTDTSSRSTVSAVMHESRPEIPSSKDEHNVKQKVIGNQRRRICEDIQRCYPIQPITGKTLAFSIRGLHVPNSEELDSEPPDRIAAALGHVAHLIILLSFYLSQPLPYPVNPRSSSSTIEDPISLLKTNASTTQTYKDEKSLRTYPLFSKGVPHFRFEYGVFLLNKNIQVLLESAYNVRVLDIRHTLPNLKYLLYVATAGEGELPARKAGGVRGLLMAKASGGGEATPVLTRTGSSESVGSALSGVLWHDGMKTAANGKLKSRGAIESLKKSIEGKSG